MAKMTNSDIEFDKLVRVGHQRACEDLGRIPCRLLGEGNPNHPMYDLHLFGEPAAQFMSRQYKAA